MSVPNSTMNTKKRSASEVGAIACPLSKKATTKDAVSLPAAAAVSTIPGIAGWQYPSLPMGMISPMPYCMPGNPFLNPFMGMFPPFWLPAAAMAAATMPAFAAASAANATAAGVCGMPGAAAAMQPSTALWPMMMCSAAMQQSCAVPPAPAVTCGPARTSSGVSSELAIPSTSCTNSVPTAAVQSPASPPPMSTSPSSVCNGLSESEPVTGKERAPEDDEFASFIDSFLRADDGELADADLRVLQSAALMSTGGSHSSDDTVACELSMPRNDSHSLLSLLGEDLGL